MSSDARGYVNARDNLDTYRAWVAEDKARREHGELPAIQPGTTVTTDDALCELCGHSDAIHSGSMGCLGKFEDEDCLCEALIWRHNWEPDWANDEEV